MNEVSFGLYRKLVVLIFSGIILLMVLCFGIPSFLGPTNKLQKADVIVAISGGDTQARTAEAVRLQKEGYGSQLIFSGAAQDPNGPSNAAAMRQGALQAGVDAADINVEELARDTLENASDTAAIINKNHYHSIILVTSQYHQRRAYLEFHHLLGNNVKIINHPAPNDRHWPGRDWWLHPSSLFLGIAETIKAIYVWANYTFN
jgi:uncharacterized SAM-binding protein YcdF (DUF218 family)